MQSNGKTNRGGLVRMAEYARMIGVNRSTVSRYRDIGMPLRNGMVDVAECNAWRADNIDSSRAPEKTPVGFDRLHFPPTPCIEWLEAQLKSPDLDADERHDLKLAIRHLEGWRELEGERPAPMHVMRFGVD